MRLPNDTRDTHCVFHVAQNAGMVLIAGRWILSFMSRDPAKPHVKLSHNVYYGQIAVTMDSSVAMRYVALL